MGRVSRYKKPKAANDPERYDQLVFGDKVDQAPTKGAQKMTVREKRMRSLMARVHGRPDPFAKDEKKRGQRGSAPAEGRPGRKAAAGDGNGGESSSDDDESAVPAGPVTETESSADGDGAPAKKAARLSARQAADGPSMQTASDRALNAQVKEDAKRREGESMKDYKLRLKRESNRIIKATNKQSFKRTAKSKAYFKQKKEEERRKRQEKEEAHAEKMAERSVPVVPFGAVNDRPPAIAAFKKRMKQRMQKVMTHSASQEKHKALSSVEAYRAQVQDAYKNMKLKQAHNAAKPKPAKRGRRHAASFVKKFEAGAFDD